MHLVLRATRMCSRWSTLAALNDRLILQRLVHHDIMGTSRRCLGGLVLLVLLVGVKVDATAQAPDSLLSQAAPVVFAGDTLFLVYHRVGSYSPTRRAALVARNIEGLDALPRAEFDSLSLENNLDGGIDIIYRDRVINSITPRDAQTENTTIEDLAADHLTIIRQALIRDYEVDSWTSLISDIAKFILFLGILVLLWIGINKLFNNLRYRLRKSLRSFVEKYSHSEHGRILSLIPPSTQASVLLAALRVLRILTLLFLLYLSLPFIFSQLAYTRGFGEQLLGYVINPLTVAWYGFISFIPKLIFIVVIIWLGYQLIKLIGWFFDKVRIGQININGFYTDWAKPTANLVRALVVVFTLIIIFPYLPGNDSPAFQGVSVFIGLLLSLGGAAAIANVVSGIILTYMRPFQVGHRVKINDTVGDVVGKNLLVTRIQTTKNEEITVPNAALLSGGIINYTALSESHGLVLHTSITIGYDVPWPKVHELLLSAAAKTPSIEADPPPFILQKALQDWYVEYELNATTRNSHAMPRTYSNLHANIQDAFREADVEIMSPHYMALRKGDDSTVPKA